MTQIPRWSLDQNEPKKEEIIHLRQADRLSPANLIAFTQQQQLLSHMIQQHFFAYKFLSDLLLFCDSSPFIIQTKFICTFPQSEEKHYLTVEIGTWDICFCTCDKNNSLTNGIYINKNYRVTKRCPFY